MCKDRMTYSMWNKSLLMNNLLLFFLLTILKNSSWDSLKRLKHSGVFSLIGIVLLNSSLSVNTKSSFSVFSSSSKLLLDTTLLLLIILGFWLTTVSFASAVSFASTVPVLGASSVGGEALEISAYDRPVGTLALISSGFGGAFYGAKKHIHSKYPRSLFLQFTFNKLIAFLPPAFNRAAETRIVWMFAVLCTLVSVHAFSMSNLMPGLLFRLGCLDLNAASNFFEGFF